MVRAQKPVSGPGRLSQRTDLTPQGGDSRGQPVRAPSGQPYGDRQALVAQQQAAPLQSSSEPTAPRGLTGGVFGPTERPGEPPTSGAPLGPGRSPEPIPTPAQEDPDLMLRAIYSVFPHPDIARLLLRRRNL